MEMQISEQVFELFELPGGPKSDPTVLGEDSPLYVALIDAGSGLVAVLSYLDDNSYADYDIAVGDLEGNEVATGAGGLGTDNGGEGMEPHTLSEVLEEVNSLLGADRRFERERVLAASGDDAEEIAEILQDRAYEALVAYREGLAASGA